MGCWGREPDLGLSTPGRGGDGGGLPLSLALWAGSVDETPLPKRPGTTASCGLPGQAWAQGGKTQGSGCLGLEEDDMARQAWENGWISEAEVAGREKGSQVASDSVSSVCKVGATLRGRIK